MRKPKKEIPVTYPHIVGKATDFEARLDGMNTIHFRLESRIPVPEGVTSTNMVVALGMYGCIIVESNQRFVTVKLPYLWNCIAIEETEYAILDHFGRIRILISADSVVYATLFSVDVECIDRGEDVTPLLKGWLTCAGNRLNDSEQVMDEDVFRNTWTELVLLNGRNEALRLFQAFGETTMRNYLLVHFPDCENPLMYWDSSLEELAALVVKGQERL